MKRMNGLVAAALGTLALSPLQAIAQSAPAPTGQVAPGVYMTTPDDQWHVDAAVYGWAPTIDGRSNFPLGSGQGVSISPQDILNNLKLAGLASVSVSKGNVGGFVDLIYLDVGKHKQRDVTINTPEGPVTGAADINFDVKSLVGTVAGTYTVYFTPELNVQLLAGARALSLKETLNLNGVGGGPFEGASYNPQEKQTIWNGIVGARGRLSFGPQLKWFIPYYVDVGTGNSDVTWQIMSGVGYAFGWGDIGATYRYMDFKGKSDDVVQDLSFKGPLLGVVLHW